MPGNEERGWGSPSLPNMQVGMVVLVALGSLLAVAVLLGQLRGHQLWGYGTAGMPNVLGQALHRERERRESQKQC